MTTKVFTKEEIEELLTGVIDEEGGLAPSIIRQLLEENERLVRLVIALIDQRDVAFAERDAALERQKWQPIKTAPKDKSYILLFFGKGYRDSLGNLVSVGFWSARNDNWWLDALTGGGVSDCEPTHWMPLPAPKEIERIKNEG